MKVSSNLSMSVRFIIILSNTDVALLRCCACCDWFSVEFRPEVHQADVKKIGNLPVDPKRRAAPLDGLRNGLLGMPDVFSQRTEVVPLLQHDHFSVDYILIVVYSHLWRLMDKIIHPTIIPVNGLCFQVACPRALTEEQARNAVFLFLKMYKVKKQRSPRKVVMIDIDDEFLLNVLQD